MRVSKAEIQKVIDQIPDAEHWVQKSFHKVIKKEKTTEEAYCLLGAVTMSVRRDAHPSCWWDDYSKIMRFLAADMPTNFSSIVRFNDDPKTTYADVRGLLDRALERAE